MKTRTYYDVLGVRRGAMQSDIRAAYKQMVLLHHPDKNHGNESKSAIIFNEIKEAYKVLSDDSLRGAYDKTLPSLPPIPSIPVEREIKPSLSGLFKPSFFSDMERIYAEFPEYLSAAKLDESHIIIELKRVTQTNAVNFEKQLTSLLRLTENFWIWTDITPYSISRPNELKDYYMEFGFVRDYDKTKAFMDLIEAVIRSARFKLENGNKSDELTFQLA